MAGGPFTDVLRFLRRAAPGDAAAQTDRALLERFAAGRDAAAFEALLGRHGPMVWAVCRERLRHRLARRGVGLTAGLSAAVLPGAGQAAVPPRLAVATVKAALAAAAGGAAAKEIVPLSVTALAEGVMRAMFLTKVKIVG